MDSYTAKTKEWLDARFRQTTKDGIFFAHQNIYGFKSPYVEDGIVLRYVIAYNVLKALKMLRFESLLDVGGAEGYMSALFKKIFNVQVRSCDLSEQACLRAREIFGVEADPVDSVSLPYDDESFDVVLSSESLEHIPRYETVLKELLRVARRAVVITVPHDGPEVVAENIRNNVPHGHLHDFTLDSFKSLIPSGYGFRAWGLHSKALRLPSRLIEGRPIDVASRRGIKRLLVHLINPFVRWSGKFLNQRAFKLFLKIDPWFSQGNDAYRQLVFIIAKDPSCLSEDADPAVDPDLLIDFKVPLYKIKSTPQVAAIS